MRISSSPFSGIVTPPTSGELVGESPLANAMLAPAGNAQTGVQFGQATENPQVALKGTEQTASSLLALLFQGQGDAPTSVAPTVEPLSCGAAPAEVAPTDPVAPVAGSPSTDANDPANAPKAADAAFLDNSVYSSPEALKRWEPLVANLPPDERLQAQKELNRPIAAARMAAGKGPESAQAMEFINANPALKTAVDVGKHGGNADGKITNKDLKAFAKHMENAANNADKELIKYPKDNPDADPQSLELVRNASLMQANLPLVSAADPHHALGAANKSAIDGNISADDMKGLSESNPGLAGALKQSCNTWSQPGFLGQLDQAGKKGRDLAAHSPDQLFNANNLTNWIKSQAPTNGGQFASMLSDAATLNAVAGIDISKLDANVFDKPASYSGAQKAAVMVKLQQTQQSVIAGRSLHNTEKTEEGLADRISQLQADADVQAFLGKSIPEQERSLVRSDASLQKAVTEQMQNVNSGQALQTDMATADRATNKRNPNADYSGAISGLSAQLQLQKDLFPDAEVPDAERVLSSRPDLQNAVAQSYVHNFSEGGALKQLLGQKKVDASDALQTADNRKALYESALPSDFTQGQQSDYVDATLGQLQASKKGRKLLEGKVDQDHGPSVATQLASEMGPRALQSVMGFASVSDMLAQGNKAGAAQTLYDSTKTGLQAIKGGYDAAAKMVGREASAGLGRMAGQVAGRAVAMVAGEATGLAAGAALGASIPIIGWVADAAMAIGFGISAIIDAVKKHKAQKAFDHNVDPVLTQFGIAKAH
ncbi:MULTISPECIES: type III effector HrpK domain-containing protein [unclassified Pseudomonas]|uniref:type III effector HrpK domain-containing protein n=1 Tax=unclassified Pseudomonas TaxID=196821 RepID=UPI002AC965CE|nr:MULTISPECIES: type III effector HrpK domain-containing protein [unclassified Pseudomonas]MEB0046711.1 type III effector HrpK domain-containing protein [Pseudomonas sp. Dout3]MEB0098593.1 type III effector HrpK domain-containing protein [Pseudomonas sp. DC1.2]WPX56634.1 type III effector HrpK domain-containing protein [Pseudomonas sp. DC1.2]